MSKEPSKSKDDILLTIANKYAKSPIIQGLAAFIVGAVGSTGNVPALAGTASMALQLINLGVDRLVRERQEVFFEELAKGEQHLTLEIIKNESFIHAFISTYQAAIKTQQHEKIRGFAHLLIYASRENLLESEILEDFVNILDSLSNRELRILLILKYYEDKYPQIEQNTFRVLEYWELFKAEVNKELNISSEQLSGLLIRLTRTGLYEIIVGMWDIHGQGRLTQLFADFATWLKQEDSKIAD